MLDKLEVALKEANLLDYFSHLPPSHQKEYLKWIKEAARQETQSKRIVKTVEMLKAKQK